MSVTAAPAPVEGAVALRAYLRMLAGREPLSSFMELRPMGLDGKPVLAARAFVRIGDLDVLEERVRVLSERMNVFVGVAPRALPQGRAQAVSRAWTLWVDIDAEEQLDALRRFRPVPAVVVRSGSGGVHAYWPLREPLGAGHVQRANRRLARALGADMQATDPARILRPPGSLNHKHEPARLVVCTRLVREVFTAGEVVGGLADSEHYARPAANGGRWRRRRIESDSPVAERALEGLARTVAQAKAGGRNTALFWAACRGLEHVDEDGWPEAHVFDALSMAAIDAGLPGDEIRQVFRSARLTVGGAAS